MAKKKHKTASCDTCVECIYVGEGGFICGDNYEKIVIEDFTPTADWLCCGGKKYIEERD